MAGMFSMIAPAPGGGLIRRGGGGDRAVVRGPNGNPRLVVGSVRNFNSWILAQGGTPLLRRNNSKLATGPFYADVTITDNAAVNADLTVQSVWDARVQELYGSGSSDVKAVMRIAAVQLCIFDASFRTESNALKEALMDDAYIRIQRGDQVTKLPLVNSVWEPWLDTQVTQATPADGDFTLLKGPPRKIDGGGMNVDLFQDILEFRLDTPINWSTGNILAKVKFYGWIAPDNYPGAVSGDGQSCTMTIDGGPVAISDAIPDTGIGAVGPIDFADIRQAGLGTLADIGYDGAQGIARV